jgi:hypothetical protein
MVQEYRDFMELHINNYHTVESGYVRNLDAPILDMYEKIYREYLDKNFILTKWCSACVFDCLKRLYTYYLSLPKEEVFVFPDDLDKIVPMATEPAIAEQTKKRGRPKATK